MPTNPPTNPIQPPNFIAQAGNSADSTIPNIAFYPSISLLDFQKISRIDKTHADERQIDVLKTALREVNHDLKKWRETLTKLTPAPSKLSETKGDVYGEGTSAEHEKVSDYKTAVYALAKGKLTEKYRDYDTTKSGRYRSETLEINADEYFQESREAIRRIIGKPRATIVLI